MTHLRVLPWRMLYLEGAEKIVTQSFIRSRNHPVLGVSACPGAPACSQATVSTRALARRLADRVPGSLHVAGCAKGCARRTAAAVTLVGREGLFDLVRDGKASDIPEQTGLSEAALEELFP